MSAALEPAHYYMSEEEYIELRWEVGLIGVRVGSSGEINIEEKEKTASLKNASYFFVYMYVYIYIFCNCEYDYIL